MLTFSVVRFWVSISPCTFLARRVPYGGPPISERVRFHKYTYWLGNTKLRWIIAFCTYHAVVWSFFRWFDFVCRFRHVLIWAPWRERPPTTKVMDLFVHTSWHMHEKSLRDVLLHLSFGYVLISAVIRCWCLISPYLCPKWEMLNVCRKWEWHSCVHPASHWPTALSTSYLDR